MYVCEIRLYLYGGQLMLICLPIICNVCLSNYHVFVKESPSVLQHKNAADKTSGKESSTAAIIRIAILLTFTRTPPVSVLL